MTYNSRMCLCNNAWQSKYIASIKSSNCLTPKPLGVITPGIIFFNTQWTSLICPRTGIETTIALHQHSSYSPLGYKKNADGHVYVYIQTIVPHLLYDYLLITNALGNKTEHFDFIMGITIGEW